jgi:hypothetical protein
MRSMTLSESVNNTLTNSVYWAIYWKIRAAAVCNLRMHVGTDVHRSIYLPIYTFLRKTTENE